MIRALAFLVAMPGLTIQDATPKPAPQKQSETISMTSAQLESVIRVIKDLQQTNADLADSVNYWRGKYDQCRAGHTV